MKALYHKLEDFRNKHTYLYVFLLGLLFLVVLASVALLLVYLWVNFSIVSTLSILFVAYIIIMIVGVVVSEELDDLYEK